MDRFSRQDQGIMDRSRELRRERREREQTFVSGKNSTAGEDERGHEGMVKVIRLNGAPLYINLFQVQCIESIPETKIKMMNGDYYLVKDSVESIIERAKEFINCCFTFQKPGTAE